MLLCIARDPSVRISEINRLAHLRHPLFVDVEIDPLLDVLGRSS